MNYRPSIPSEFEPGQLRSFWDMLEFNASDFIALMHVISNSEDGLRGTRGPLPNSMSEVNNDAADTIKNTCVKIGLPVSALSTEYIRKAKTSENLIFAFRHVKSTIHHELNGRMFFEPDSKYKEYFDGSQLFGIEVFNSFPSANDDIAEAGNCLALERPTACVMHLMRVCEAGLKALAKALSIGERNDWGSYIRDINTELDKRAKTAGARSNQEQFYSEASASFDRLKRAWRNPAMHVDRSYTQQRAEEIFLAVKSFMVYLASHLSE